MDRLREGSIASSSSLYQSDSDRSTALVETHHGIKRPLEEEEDPSPEKKRKLDPFYAQTGPSRSYHIEVPDEIWQAIFLHLGPISLGNLLISCKRFHRLLTSHVPYSGRENGILQIKKPEDIWRQSREIHRPHMPKPLIGKNELEMWQLLGGKHCQFCNRVAVLRESPPSLWDGGPGEDSARIIWPFGIRCCGPCLEKRSQTVGFPKALSSTHQSLAN